MSLTPQYCNSPVQYWGVTLKTDVETMYIVSFSQTESALARTTLSPFARCILGLNRHSPAIFIKICYAITACMALGFTLFTNREMVNFQKLDFFAIFNIKFCHYRSARISGTNQIMPATHNAKRDLQSKGVVYAITLRLASLTPQHTSRFFQT